jgi:hypothetical protein
MESKIGEGLVTSAHVHMMISTDMRFEQMNHWRRGHLQAAPILRGPCDPNGRFDGPIPKAPSSVGGYVPGLRTRARFGDSPNEKGASVSRGLQDERFGRISPDVRHDLRVEAELRLLDGQGVLVAERGPQAATDRRQDCAGERAGLGAEVNIGL